MFNVTLRSVVRFVLILTLLSGSTITLRAQDAAAGEKLFNANCASCHALGKRMTGPDLHGVQERWAGREEILHKFIKNSQSVIKGGDEYAVDLYEKFGKVVMPAQALSDEEINSVLAYIEADRIAFEEAKNAPVVSNTGESNTEEGGLSFEQSVLALGLILIILLLILVMVISIKVKINRLIAEKNEGDKAITESFISEVIADIKFFITKQMNPTLLVLTIGGILSLFLMIDLYNRGQDLGLQQGYAPDQPIKFSHKLHAGQYQIDCQYCHTGVEKSKNANIPSANICMNCHINVDQGPKYGKEEIAKIYASIGFNPEDRTYSGEQKPIEWVRIHNLPDHVYFSHQQHVVAGGLDCENCHGKVAEMEVVEQVSLLEMGWCINCHRETEVQIDNNYYQEHFHDVFKDDYAKYQEKNPTSDATLGEFLKDHKKYTIADLGGIECQRCHY